MPLLGTAGETQALNSLDATGSPVNLIADLALHVGTTAATGTNENANTGSYARQPCTWNASSGGSAKTNSSALTYSTAATVPVSYVGGWSSATYGGGTFGIGAPLGSSVTAAGITVAPGAVSLAAS